MDHRKYFMQQHAKKTTFTLAYYILELAILLAKYDCIYKFQKVLKLTTVFSNWIFSKNVTYHIQECV